MHLQKLVQLPHAQLPGCAYHHVVGEVAVLLVGDPALHCLHLTFLQKSLEGVLKSLTAVQGELEMAVVDGVRSHQELVGKDLQRGQQGGGEKTGGVHPRPYGQANARRGPETGGSGQAFNGAAMLEDDPGAQKTNAADHLGSNPGGIGSPGAVKVGALQICQVGKAIFRHDHQQSGGAADNDMGADAGLLIPLASLKADEGPA